MLLSNCSFVSFVNCHRLSILSTSIKINKQQVTYFEKFAQVYDGRGFLQKSKTFDFLATIWQLLYK